MPSHIGQALANDRHYVIGDIRLNGRVQGINELVLLLTARLRQPASIDREYQ